MLCACYYLSVTRPLWHHGTRQPFKRVQNRPQGLSQGLCNFLTRMGIVYLHLSHWLGLVCAVSFSIFGD